MNRGVKRTRSDPKDDDNKVIGHSTNLFVGNIENECEEDHHDGQVNKKQKHSTLFEGFSKENLEEIVKLIKQGAEIDGRDIDGITPLHWAAAHGHVDIIRALLERGAKIDAVANNGFEPLHSAVQRGHIEAIGVLLDEGAAIDAAVQSGKVESDVLPDEGVTIVAVDLTGFTPLHLAVQFGQVEAVKVLLKKDATIDAAATKGGMTPLLLATILNCIETIRVLLENGAKIDKESTLGFTPLFWAAMSGNIEVIRLLLEKGAKIDGETANWYKPLIGAITKGQVEAIRVLLNRKANVSILNAINETALHVAAKNGKENVIQILAMEGVEADDKNRFVVRQEPNGDGDTARDLICKNHPQLLNLNQNPRAWQGKLVDDRMRQLKDDALIYLLDMLQSGEAQKVTQDLENLETKKRNVDKTKPENKMQFKDVNCKIGLGLFHKLKIHHEEIAQNIMKYIHTGPLTYTAEEDEKCVRIAKELYRLNKF